MVISPQKGKSRRESRVDREERGPFSVGFSPDRPIFGRSIFLEYNQSIFLNVNNAIKKSPCRHFLFRLDIFVEILKIYPICFHHFGFGILLKEKGGVKHIANVLAFIGILLQIVSLLIQIEENNKY